MKLHPGQLEVLNAPQRKKIVAAGRAWGKTTLAVEAALQWVREGVSVDYVVHDFGVGETVKRAILSRSAGEVLFQVRPSGWQMYCEDGRTSISISVLNKPLLESLSFYLKNLLPDQREALVIDECAATDYRLDALSEWIDDALFVATPKGDTWFGDLYHYALQHPDIYFAGQYATDGNPHADMELLTEAQAGMTASQIKQEFEGAFVPRMDIERELVERQEGKPELPDYKDDLL